MWIKDKEDMLLQAVKVMLLLFSPTNCSPLTIPWSTDPSFPHRVGHSVYILLDIAIHTNSKDLRNGAVRALKNIIDEVKDPDILVMILPGTCSKLSRLCVSDYKKVFAFHSDLS